MADKGKATIVIKKISGGGHGHHGGAWKVAYADFVTAMMAFFLVMWLMGSDEETKAAISHYFNHPSTPYKNGRDPQSDSVHPMGEKNGAGENVMNGNEGLNPEEAQDPLRPVSQGAALQLHEDLAELAKEELDGNAYGFEVQIENLTFSVNENLLFDKEKTELAARAEKYMKKIGTILQGHRGYVTVAGHVDGEPGEKKGGRFPSSYEFSIARSVNVMNYLIEKNYVREDRVVPVGVGTRHPYTSNATPEGRQKNRRMEFTVSFKKPH